MNWIRVVDAWVVSRFERASGTVQALTGIDCLHQYHFASLLGCAFLLSFTAFRSRTFGVEVWFALIVTAASMANALWGEIDNIIRSQAAKGTMNHRKIDPWEFTVRMAWLAILAVDVTQYCLGLFRLSLAEFLAHGWAISLWISVNLRACNPKPPCQGKIRQWVSAAFTFRQPVRVSQ